jgi:AraC-like DNA-binding protein
VHFSWDAESTEPVSPIPYIRLCSENDLELPAPAYTVYAEGIGDVELWSFYDVQGLEGHFVRLAKEFLHQEPGYEIVMRGYLLQLLGTLIRFQLDKRFRAANERSKIAATVEAIRNRPAHAWTIPELAALAGYHPTYFAELFREATGYTPKHYLMLERIKQAQQMLLQEKSVEAVASKLGYSSVHYFCRNFKAVTGLTPTEFKQRNWGF